MTRNPTVSLRKPKPVEKRLAAIASGSMFTGILHIGDSAYNALFLRVMGGVVLVRGLSHTDRKEMMIPIWEMITLDRLGSAVINYKLVAEVIVDIPTP